MTQLIDLLREYKQENKLSWYRIAKDLRVSYQTVYNWDRDLFAPSPVYQRMILEYIGKKKSIDTISKV